MSNVAPVPLAHEREEFERAIGIAHPQAIEPVRHILNNAPAPLNTIDYLRYVFAEQDCLVRLLEDLRDQIAPEDLVSTTAINSTQSYVWTFFGILLMLQGKAYQAIEVFDALYTRMLHHQTTTGERFHKGLPLYQMSQCLARGQRWCRPSFACSRGNDCHSRYVPLETCQLFSLKTI